MESDSGTESRLPAIDHPMSGDNSLHEVATEESEMVRILATLPTHS